MENHTDANSGNKQADCVTPNPWSPREPTEKAQSLRSENGGERHNEEPVMLKEGDPSVAFALIVHTPVFETPNKEVDRSHDPAIWEDRQTTPGKKLPLSFHSTLLLAVTL